MFIHSSADTDFGFFILALRDIAVMTSCSKFSMGLSFISLDPYLGMIAESYGKQVGKELPDYFSKQLPFTILPSVYEGSSIATL